MITNALELYEFCNSTIGNIKCFFVSKETCEENNSLVLKSRHDVAQTIEGTMSYHAFIPLDKFRLQCKILASDETGDIKVVDKTLLQQDEQEVAYFINSNDINIDSIVAFIRDGIWHLGKVTEKMESDFEVKLYSPDGERSLTSGVTLINQRVHVSIDDVLAIVTSLKGKTIRTRRFHLSQNERNQILLGFHERVANFLKNSRLITCFVCFNQEIY